MFTLEKVKFFSKNHIVFSKRKQFSYVLRNLTLSIAFYDSTPTLLPFGVKFFLTVGTCDLQTLSLRRLSIVKEVKRTFALSR